MLLPDEVCHAHSFPLQGFSLCWSSTRKGPSRSSAVCLVPAQPRASAQMPPSSEAFSDHLSKEGQHPSPLTLHQRVLLGLSWHLIKMTTYVLFTCRLSVSLLLPWGVSYPCILSSAVSSGHPTGSGTQYMINKYLRNESMRVYPLIIHRQQLRFREGESLAQGHTENQRQNSSPAQLT